MRQVTGPVVSTTLVLLSVFVPIAFLPGITGELYRQFALTMAGAVVISSINALTLSPALCAVLLRERRKEGKLWGWFNKTLEKARGGYVSGASVMVGRKIVTSLALAAVIALAVFAFKLLPTGFLPKEDQGVVFVDVQLPDTAALVRTEEVMGQVSQTLLDMPEISNVITVSGFSLINNSNLSKSGLAVASMKPWGQRDRTAQEVLGAAQAQFARIPNADIFAFAPPSIQGLGNTSGFDFRLQAVQGQEPIELAGVLRGMVMSANQRPEIGRAFSTYSAEVPRIFIDLDREKAEITNVPVSSVFTALQTYLGAFYVNDFNLKDRVFQVRVQADETFRDEPDDIDRLYVRSRDGNAVPLRALMDREMTVGTELYRRYNQFTSAQISGQAAPGYSSGQAMDAMAAVAEENLPDGFSYEWSTMSYQQQQLGNEAIYILLLAVLFAYLFLVAQYESFAIPWAVLLSVIVAAFGGILALHVAGIAANIYAQIGFVLLIGLASKNAILIVEFAKTQHEKHQKSVPEAAAEGARQRFRAVLMTALSFILGVLPLVLAGGAGANSRQTIGVVVFGGMLAATLVGIFFVPALFAIFQGFRRASSTESGETEEDAG
jgi:hydrophobe/amphiphile efflux-1 (HAE1) family protein